MLKRILSLILVFVLASSICTPVQAKSEIKKAKSGRYYRIRYAGNKRYLDIPSENYNDNGTQLQLWDYVYGNQNQIFYLKDTGDGWHISGKNGKIIEVRESSHDDFASVAQWDYHDLKCGLWTIKKNSDGTVSFKNKESGKYLNVEGGGNAKNGTKIIQYRNDKTVAMKFYLELLGTEDILSAYYERKIDSSELQWERYTPFVDTIQNETPFSYKNDSGFYYPTTGQKFFVSANFLSPNTVGKMVRQASFNESTKEQIEEAVLGEMTSEAVISLINGLGSVIGLFENIPGLGCALGVLKVLYDKDDKEQWNRFVTVADVDATGRSKGVIVYTYYTVTDVPIWGPLADGTTAYGWWHHIKCIPTVEYKQWTGDNFGDVNKIPASVKNGEWTLQFK